MFKFENLKRIQKKKVIEAMAQGTNTPIVNSQKCSFMFNYIGYR